MDVDKAKQKEALDNLKRTADDLVRCLSIVCDLFDEKDEGMAHSPSKRQKQDDVDKEIEADFEKMRKLQEEEKLLMKQFFISSDEHMVDEMKAIQRSLEKVRKELAELQEKTGKSIEKL